MQGGATFWKKKKGKKQKNRLQVEVSQPSSQLLLDSRSPSAIIDHGTKLHAQNGIALVKERLRQIVRDGDDGATSHATHYLGLPARTEPTEPPTQ
mgnify:FL=1